MGESSRVDSSAAYLFKYLLLANMFQYMEAGAVPALLLALAHSFRMQPGEVSLRFFELHSKLASNLLVLARAFRCSCIFVTKLGWSSCRISSQKI